MKIAVVGATGLVGSKMLQVLSERGFRIEQLVLVASEKSIGKEIVFNGRSNEVCSHETAIRQKPDIALFSAGGATSLEWAPHYAAAGVRVIDNSSAWRMDVNTKLIVPEVNGHLLGPNDRIIANPNCSTIQLVLALKPLHDAYRVKRIVVSTYQSVTGTGVKAVQQLMNERSNEEGEGVYPYPIDLNVIPQVDVFTDNGYTKEEMKLVNETRKILGDSSIGITATTVRIPVIGGHSESVNVEFYKEFELDEVRQKLQAMPGIMLVDNPEQRMYPMPLYAHEKDDVLVGRLRRDESNPKTLNMWIVADNLRKGAATNAVQIAEQYL